MSTTEMVDAADITPEQFAAGVPFQTLGRTITEADVMAFAGLTGDQNPQHCDAEWCRANSMFGQRIAHGLLVGSLAFGKIPARIRGMGRPMGAHGVFKRPVLFGDTIHMVGKALPHKRGPGGTVPAEWRMVNQDGHVVAKIRWDYETDHFGPIAALGDGPRTDVLELTKADVQDGRLYRSAGRTLTEAHVVGFSSITGDWSAHHAAPGTDGAEGIRYVQEMLTISTAASLVPLDVPRIIAARKAQFLFHRPMAVGDTMFVEGHVAEKTPVEGGYVNEVHAFHSVNQRGEHLSTLVLHMLMSPLPD